MRKWLKRGVWISVLAAVLAAGGFVTSYAETRIGNVRLVFSDQLAEGRMLEPDVIGYGAGYEVADVEWSKDVDVWRPGSKVTAEVTLVADDGWEFSGAYGKSSCRISGADYVSVKKKDGSLVVKAEYYPTVWLAAPEQAGWGNEDRTVAVWKKVPYAAAYQLKLYADGEQVTTLTLESTTVDLSPYMTGEADYSYEVRGTFKDSSGNKYIKPGSYTASQNILLENLGDVGGSWTQSAEGTRYSDSSGNNVVNGWQIIVGQWYYFDDNGYAVTGWQRINGQWYYFKENHTMATGWVQADGRWYYMTSDGTMKTGWQQEVPGVWYYFNDDGSMATDTHIGEYYVGPDGIYVP